MSFWFTCLDTDPSFGSHPGQGWLGNGVSQWREHLMQVEKVFRSPLVSLRWHLSQLHFHCCDRLPDKRQPRGSSSLLDLQLQVMAHHFREVKAEM